jgi:D-beta-D-heptose 7-phosphate kinase/D-beta-D-heptose 1-phosphate adenosyltransferase
MLPEIHAVLGLLEGGFSRLKVLVVGDLMLDRYILGEVDRISPEAPVPVLRHAQRFSRAGGAANVAMNLAGLGCQPLLAGFWGDDAERRELEAFLDAAKIDPRRCGDDFAADDLQDANRGAQAAVAAAGHREPRQARAADLMQRLRELVEPLVGKVHAVVLSDYAKGALTAEVCEAVIRAARKAGVPVLADPKTPDFEQVLRRDDGVPEPFGALRCDRRCLA